MYTYSFSWKTGIYAMIVVLVISFFGSVLMTEHMYEKTYHSLVPVNASFISPSLDDKSVSIDVTSVVVVPDQFGGSLDDDGSIIEYIVQQGDTLSEIARDYGTTVTKLKEINNLDGSTLRVGMSLYIAPVKGIIYTLKEKANPIIFCNKYDLDLDEFMSVNGFREEMRLLEKGEEVFIPGVSHQKGIELGLIPKPKPKPISKPHIKKPTSIVSVAKKNTIYSVTPRVSFQPAGAQQVVSSKNISRKKDIILAKWVDTYNVNNGFAYGNCTNEAAKRSPRLFPYLSKSRQYRTFGGNAKQWYRNAQRAGLKVSSIPSVGAIIVMNAGSAAYRQYGHVAVVNAVDREKKTVTIVEKNYAGINIITKRLIHLNDTMTQKYGSSSYIIGYIPMQKLPNHILDTVKELQNR